MNFKNIPPLVSGGSGYFLGPQPTLIQDSKQIQTNKRLFELFEASSSEELQTKRKQRPIGLTEKRLCLLISKAERKEAQTKNQANLFNFDEKKILTVSSQNQHLQIFRIDPDTQKAIGNTATIHDAFHINTGKFVTLKIARNDKYPESRNSLIHEKQGLIDAHARFSTKKVQAAPLAFFEIPTLEGSYCGFAGKTYAFDLYSLFEQKTSPNLQTKLLWCYDLTVALAQLMVAGLVHGDLKIENVLCKEGKYRLKVILGDFGAYFDLTKLQEIALNFNSFTLNYCPYRDFKFIEEAVKEDNRELYANVRKAHDVYALGCVFHEIMTEGQPPYPLDGDFPDHSTPFNAYFLEHHIENQKFSTLVTRMLDPDYCDRPDIFSVLESLPPILNQYKCDFKECRLTPKNDFISW